MMLKRKRGLVCPVGEAVSQRCHLVCKPTLRSGKQLQLFCDGELTYGHLEKSQDRLIATEFELY